MLPAPHGVGGEAEIEERRLGEEALALGGAEAIAVGRAGEERVERRRRRRRAPVVVEESDARARQEPRVRGLVVEALEAAPLFVAEVVADRVAQVGAERSRRQARARGVLLGDRVDGDRGPQLRDLEEALVAPPRARPGARTRRRTRTAAA